MTEQFSPKIYSRIAVNISKNSLLYIFSSTVTICVTISDMKIKYWRINLKSTQLRLKTLINNDFLVNGFQILT